MFTLSNVWLSSAAVVTCLRTSYIDVFLAFPESRCRCGSLLSDCLSSCFLPPSSSACWDACPSPVTRTCCWSLALLLAVQLWIWKHRCPVYKTKWAGETSLKNWAKKLLADINSAHLSANYKVKSLCLLRFNTAYLCLNCLLCSN